MSMNDIKKFFFFLLVLPWAAASLCAQAASAERIVVPFSDASKPGLVKASLINGSIAVMGYEGKEVIIETKVRGRVIGDDDRERELPDKKESKHAGMKRLTAGRGGIEVEERNNIVEIRIPAWKADYDLTIQVPRDTALQLNSVNNGGLRVENVSGDIEVANVNGSITMSRISGAVVAQTVNGDVTAAFVRLDGEKPSSLITLNGDIDITLPASAKATFKLKIDNEGEVYSDFELELRDKTEKTVEDKRHHGGHYQVRIDRTVTGSINGGGREITMKTFNGDILLRKAK
jgi:hypothetical protein